MSETTLFSSDGTPVAYVAHDDEATIYSWSGIPVAYLHQDHVYGFNGRHLGWFQDGIVWDHGGKKSGFVKETLPVYAQYEPYKAYKQYKPYRSYQQFAPYQPYKSVALADMPLSALLGTGRS